MKRNYERDYKELPGFAAKRIGETVLSCIEDYAAKRKMVTHRAGKAFWGLVDDDIIKVKFENSIAYIVDVKKHAYAHEANQ